MWKISTIKQPKDFIQQLKRSGVSQSDLCPVCCTIVRPVVEYLCPVWCTDLSCEMRNLLESLQRRVCKIIIPNEPYVKAIELLNLQTLERAVTNYVNTFSLP